MDQSVVTDTSVSERERLELVELGNDGQIVVANGFVEHHFAIGQAALRKRNGEFDPGSSQFADASQRDSCVPQRELLECNQGSQLGQSLVGDSGLVEHECCESGMSCQVIQSGVGDGPGKDQGLQVAQFRECPESVVVEGRSVQVQPGDARQGSQVPGERVCTDREFLEIQDLEIGEVAQVGETFGRDRRAADIELFEAFELGDVPEAVVGEPGVAEIQRGELIEPGDSEEVVVSQLPVSVTRD